MPKATLNYQCATCGRKLITVVQIETCGLVETLPERVLPEKGKCECGSKYHFQTCSQVMPD